MSFDRLCIAWPIFTIQMMIILILVLNRAENQTRSHLIMLESYTYGGENKAGLPVHRHPPLTSLSVGLMNVGGFSNGSKLLALPKEALAAMSENPVFQITSAYTTKSIPQAAPAANIQMNGDHIKTGMDVASLKDVSPAMTPRSVASAFSEKSVTAETTDKMSHPISTQSCIPFRLQSWNGRNNSFPFQEEDLVSSRNPINQIFKVV